MIPCIAERISEAAKALDSHRTAIQSKLASLGTFPPHVVDIDWKLSYQVRVSTKDIYKTVFVSLLAKAILFSFP